MLQCVENGYLSCRRKYGNVYVYSQPEIEATQNECGNILEWTIAILFSHYTQISSFI